MEFTKLIKKRYYLVIGLFLLTALIVATFVDFKLSSVAYNPDNTSWYGIIGSGIAHYPIIFALVFGGTGLIISRIKVNKAVNIICIILGIVAIGLGAYYVYDYFKEMSEFKNTESYASVIKVLAIIVAVIIPVGIILVTVLNRKKFNRKTLFMVSLSLLVTTGVIAIMCTGLKYFMSRPRPRFIFASENPEELFSYWFIPHPFKALSEGDNYKSFPSGHSAYGSIAMLVAPLMVKLNDKYKDNTRAKNMAFFFGFYLAFVGAISRIFAGAHFLSDVTFAMLLGLGCIALCNFIMSKVEPKLDKYLN